MIPSGPKLLFPNAPSNRRRSRDAAIFAAGMVVGAVIGIALFVGAIFLLARAVPGA